MFKMYQPGGNLMKKMFLAVALLMVSLTAMADSYTIDPKHTFPNFTINHLGFSTLHGRFDKTTGKITMDRKKGTGSVEVVVDMASVSTGFKKRDEHLKSPDFFNVAEFPTMTFKSTSVEFKGKGATVTGNLTIKGVTRPVTLAVDSINCGANPFSKKEECGFNATTRIKRSDFGIKYGLPAVGDDLDITLEVEAFKN
jgi:polyisoprenoid-binding protein YceI